MEGKAMDLLTMLFGEGKDLTVLQMSDRAIVVFLIALVAVRMAGRRSFGQRTPFDQVVAILLGAVISRAVVGASPFMPTIAASLVLVILHRVVGYLSVLSPRVDSLVNGTERVVVMNGEIDWDQMRSGLITPRDLLESTRARGQEDFVGAHMVVLERNGQISVIKKPQVQYHA